MIYEKNKMNRSKKRERTKGTSKARYLTSYDGDEVIDVETQIKKEHYLDEEESVYEPGLGVRVKVPGTDLWQDGQYMGINSGNAIVKIPGGQFVRISGQNKMTGRVHRFK